MHFAKWLKLSIALGAIIAITGCAHPISIAPDLNSLNQNPGTTPIAKTVGYFISAEDRAKRVTTPAGGGDSVEYAPYADLEPGLYRTLGNVFSNVFVVKDLKDAEYLKSNNISIVFVPKIETTSSSRNHFFWPPTDFGVTMECKAVNAQGTQIWNTTVKTDGGLIPVKEILGDFGLAGKRASSEALKALATQMRSAPELSK